uniref:Cytokinin riboside 5'-monophosphate phosphoribohydrolase n=1 Tax=Aegilops tauschii TaxID=37682 RepID=M8AV33_AEGTA
MEETAAAKNRRGGVGEGAIVEVEGPRFRRVCVFCGSSSGKRSSYRDAAVELGKELVARGMDLVYGGGSLGLMGEVSESVHKAGGHVIGVIPTTLMGKEITGVTVGEVVAVSGMHERKAAMGRNADAFIALPGGYGTLDELLEVGLLNVEGYYDFLLAFIDKAVDDGFIRPAHRHIFVSAPDARDLVRKLEEYVAVEEDDPAAPKLRWEIEQVGYKATLHAGIAR